MTITYDYYVIHCENNNERYKNIKNMEIKLLILKLVLKQQFVGLLKIIK